MFVNAVDRGHPFVLPLLGLSEDCPRYVILPVPFCYSPRVECVDMYYITGRFANEKHQK